MTYQFLAREQGIMVARSKCTQGVQVFFYRLKRGVMRFFKDPQEWDEVVRDGQKSALNLG